MSGDLALEQAKIEPRFPMRSPMVRRAVRQNCLPKLPGGTWLEA